MKIIKRTFKANQHPEGSLERNKLNEELITSEYQPEYHYIVESGNYQLHAFKTREEAGEYLK